MNKITHPVSSEHAFLGAFTPEDELTGFACYSPKRTRSGTILDEVERRPKGPNAGMVVMETSSRFDHEAARGFHLRRGDNARKRESRASADDRITFIKRLQGRGSAREERTAHGAVSDE